MNNENKRKLIIFDLDDTLIDTWNSLFPTLTNNAVEEMIKFGLKVKSPEGAALRLGEINRQSRNGTEAIKRFLQELGADLKFLEIGKKGFYDFNFEYKIKTLPGAMEMFDKVDADFALVTRGEFNAQIKKMEKAGINKNLFKKILAVSEYDKKKSYVQILQELKYLAEDCFVVGDRYKTDLLPAKELGIKTIYISWGRGRIFPPRKEEVDFMIKDLKEIIKIVNPIKN